MMDETLLEEIIACLPEGRTRFSYFRDQYAVYLLKRYLRTAESRYIYGIKQSRLKKLLDRPVVSDLLRCSGSGALEAERLEYLWPTESEQYVLTIGRWGHKSQYSWNQTSRPGVNLVLQLNLSNQLNEVFRLISGCDLNWVTASCHPKSHKRPATLAWARLDMDFNTGEVLIEEIQSDLIRDLERLYRRAQAEPLMEEIHISRCGTAVSRKSVAVCCAEIIASQKKIWSEAMMTAALWFAHEELGVRRIFYHTFETGRVMKRIHGNAPPRSLYRDLPEKFCFQKTKQPPQFIVNDSQAYRRLKAVENPMWYLLAS